MEMNIWIIIIPKLGTVELSTLQLLSVAATLSTLKKSPFFTGPVIPPMELLLPLPFTSRGPVVSCLMTIPCLFYGVISP